ncbi:MAG TPA: hypothetical protein VL486_06765 [Verrucomicrobiae bacterium]|nr:hypothetical protein [Verrucomicrobiae bacterium]
MFGKADTGGLDPHLGGLRAQSALGLRPHRETAIQRIAGPGRLARHRRQGSHPRDCSVPALGLPEVRKLWQTDGFFSDHYLKARIQKNDWWLTDDQARPLWQFCKDLYERRYLACAKNNEAFTRQELLDKILDRLGFAWTDNLGMPDQDAEPDYILFATADEKEKVIDKSTAIRYRASVGSRQRTTAIVSWMPGTSRRGNW